MKETNWDGVFKVGDKVLAFGCEGVVMSTESGFNRPLDVRFSSLGNRYFYLDGRLDEWHKEPSLKFVSREEKSVKVTKSQLGDIWDRVKCFDLQVHCDSMMFNDICRYLGLEDEK